MTTDQSQQAAVAASTTEPVSVTGQSAFHVELSPVGVVIRTVFVGEDETLHPAPLAVFNQLEGALQQIDELRRLVLRHFGDAALLGLQALQQAQQAQAQQTTAQEPTP